MHCHFLRISDDEEGKNGAQARGGCWELETFNHISLSVFILFSHVHCKNINNYFNIEASSCSLS